MTEQFVLGLLIVLVVACLFVIYEAVRFSASLRQAERSWSERSKRWASEETQQPDQTIASQEVGHD